jgi:uncharacterized protein (DUF58 family)
MTATPLVALLALVIGLAVAAYTLRAFPRRMLVAWAVLPVLMSLGLVLSEQLLPWLLAFDGLLVLVVAIDLATLPRRKWLAAEREMARTASLRNPHPVHLTISNRARRTLVVEARDDVPDECEAEPDDFTVRLAPQSRTTVHYQLQAGRRGAFRMGAIYLRVTSRLKLWQRDLVFGAASDLNVYPDMVQMEEYAILARTNRLSLAGLRRQRRIGQDNEFERLRDYTLDDNYKHIDWRSTARRGKLTVKDFQANQSQRLIFMVDCGRMMTGTVEGLSLLDHAFNAALMLAYVALRKGDSVGLVAFNDDVERYVPPRGGMNQMNRLLHASFDRFATLSESRYDEAFVYLNARSRKRSLVVLITNVIDEVNSHQVSRYLRNLVGRHLPLAVLLRDHAVFDAAAVTPHDDASMYRAAAATEIVAWRRGVLAEMERNGILALDVFPEQMTAPLVNRYLEIKARHLL